MSWSFMGFRSTRLLAALAVIAALAIVLVIARRRTSEPPWLPLPELPVPRASGYVKLPGFALHYAVYGDGDPVVLLHGGFGNSGHFAHQIPILAKVARIITIDSRGHGRSERAPDGISYHSMASDVATTLDHLGVKQASIIGWSDGGVVGLDLAITRPERVKRLLVMGTHYHTSGVALLLAHETLDAYFARCTTDYERLAPAPRQRKAVLEDLERMWNKEPNYTAEQLRSVRAPTYVLLGEHDEFVRVDHAKEMTRLIPRARLFLLPKLGHFALWEDPVAVSRILREFIVAEP